MMGDPISTNFFGSFLGYSYHMFLPYIYIYTQLYSHDSLDILTVMAILVGGFNHIEYKNGKDDIPYIMENEKQMKRYSHTGWWLTYPSEKYEFVRWDYDIPN